MYACPKPYETTWEGLCADLRDHRFYPPSAKEGDGTEFSAGRIPMLFPAEFDGKGKRPANVRRVWIAGVDLDSLSEAQIQELRIRTASVKAIWLTTWSHGQKPGYRMRAYFALSRPIEPREWESWWPRFTDLITGNLADNQCQDPCRGFFVGYPEGATPWIDITEGAPLDVEAILSRPAPKRTVDTIARKSVSVATARKWLKTLKTRRDVDGQIVAECLEAFLTGEVFAEQGERDTTLFKFAVAFAHAFPDGDPTPIIEHARASFERTEANPGDLSRKIERAQTRVLERQQDEADRTRDLVRNAIAEAFDRTEQAGRSTAYTPEEIEEYAKRNGTDSAGMRRQWIIQVDSRYWIQLAGTYQGPYTRDGFASSGLRLLAPAESHGLELTQPMNDGRLGYKPARDLMLDYGTVADEITYTLEGCDRYNPRLRSLELCKARRRKLSARHWPIVDQWLDILAGDQSDSLRLWMAEATRTDAPLAMLLLTGPKGVGKSLFAQGMSRLWTTRGPTAMRTAFDRWNHPICDVPLLFADESLPKDNRGQPRTEELREMISAGIHSVNTRFLPTAKLRGYLRLIAAANSLDILRVSGTLGKDDIDAIAERIFQVSCGYKAARWLQNEAKSAVDARAFLAVDSARNGEGDAIAEHALWLAQQIRQKGIRPRFGVYDQTSHTTVYAALTTRSDLQSAVLAWVLSFLEDPSEFWVYGADQKNFELIYAEKGELFVSPQALAGERWSLYCKHMRPPDHNKVARALSYVAGGRIVRTTRSDARRQYRKIDRERLETWADRTGYATPEEIRELIAKIELDPKAPRR